MRHITGPFLLLALAMADPLYAQDFERISGRVIYEDDPNQTLINAPGWLRGLHFLGDDLDDDSRPQIIALVPRNTENDTLCAQIVSIQGDYAATVQFDNTSAGEAPVKRLEFNTQFPAVSKQITPETGGITLTRGACAQDSEGGPTFIASFWNNAAEPILRQTGTVELVLNIHFARADNLEPTARLMHKATESATETSVPLPTPACTKIDLPGFQTFNHRCRLTVATADLTRAGETSIVFGFKAVYRGLTSRERTARIEVGAGQ